MKLLHIPHALLLSALLAASLTSVASAVAPAHAVSGFNSQCSYIDAFTEDGVLHLFMPHSWQQVLHLTLKEDALTHLPSQAFIKKLAAASPLTAEKQQPVHASQSLSLPAIISDHMVLQAGKPVAIWGWAGDGDSVSVTFAHQTKTTTASNGRWSVKLDLMPASATPGELRVTSSSPKSEVCSVLMCS